MATYPVVEDGDTIESPSNVFVLACCDCGLVHRFEATAKGKRVLLRVY